MKKATHYGHCQICGARQKLPRGRLAKHGYTTEFGYFSGTCNGSGFEPFERSTHLIQDAIEAARCHAENCDRDAAEYRAHRPETLMVEISDADTGHKRVWIAFPRAEVRQEGYRLLHGDRVLSRYRISGVTDVAAHNDERYANRLQREAANLETYAQWQEKRIENWKPAELEPIKSRDCAAGA